MPDFIEDVTNRKKKAAEAKEREAKLAAQRKKEREEEKEKRRLQKKKEKEERLERKVLLSKIIKTYAKIEGDYIKLDDVEIIKDPKGGIYGKVGDKYFFTNGKYEDLDISKAIRLTNGSYLTIVSEPYGYVYTYPADPYTATYSLATSFVLLELGDKGSYRVCRKDSIEEVVYEGSRSDVRDSESYMAEHEAEAKVAYAKTIPGQIRAQLQKREKKNTQTTGRK